ncbi:hypothetical protein FE257_002301 [Aspergillus nanangensis]|uniref:Uncharacterized protein n=1 Tax=Aspergillus nanangensis TaxID=2582783 RepID=A0AAD4CCR2_ASPNN|nr:hypothetical protein FE257_002301 [Aspergillus nanangensis]
MGQINNIAPSVAQEMDKVLQNGLRALNGEITIPGNEAWTDAVEYCCIVKNSPEDSSRRADQKWKRSHSIICNQLLKEFGPEIILKAEEGMSALIKNRYKDNALSIAHVDKEKNIRGYATENILGPTFRLPDDDGNMLVALCYELTILCCAVVQSAWLTPVEALKSSLLGHAAICDDFHKFTAPYEKHRHYMVALAIGAAYQLREKGPNILVDGTALQAVGQNPDRSLQAALAWRAVGGGTTGYNGYYWGEVRLDLEKSLVCPKVMMAMHDLLDWRCDAAAKNHENGVFAACGLGCQDPFHEYLEAMLDLAASHPLSGAYAMAGTVFLHFTSSRYGAYEYRGPNYEKCENCANSLKKITIGAKLLWDPQTPPNSFDGGKRYRAVAQSMLESSENISPAQYGISWLQYLIETGNIFVFDVLRSADPVHLAAGFP